MAEERLAEFADLLRRARRAAGLSQEELAERSGLSARAISALERGVNRTPRRETMLMLAAGLGLSDDERHRWERLRRHQAGNLVRPTSVRNPTPQPPHNLPVQLSRFFGRETEITSLSRMLRDGSARLVTLTGPGGTGKTRLAQQVAVALLDAHADGVFFVDLSPISDPLGVVPAIGATLGVWPRSDQPIRDTVVNWLQGKRLLLILDNLEQVLDAAPEISNLLGHCPDLLVLATSRAPLRVQGEREFPVQPLPVIEAESDAVRLFFDRACAVRPDFDEDAVVVAQICRRLDGLPLAIELGAASVRLFPSKTILTRLERHLPLVVTGHRDAPTRQRTLRDTIAWSYDLLPPDVRRLFRHLSIFKGGWTLNAAEAILGGDVETEGFIMLQGTETLIEHSLIQSHVWHDGSPRFTMLETIRAFGVEQLAASGELDEAHHRHATYLLRLNSGAVERLRSPRFRAWLQQCDAEIENVRLALNWATAHEPELALRLAREVGWFLLTRGGFVEARELLEQALNNSGDISIDLRAGALLDIGMQATTYFDFEVARSNVEDALALFEQLDDANGIAECVHAFGRIAAWSNDNKRAKTLFEEALVRFRSLDSSTLTVCCANLSATLLILGERDEAARVLDEGLAHGERFGDVWALVLIVGSMAEVERNRGELARSRELTRRAFVLASELQDPRYVSQTLVGAACLAIDEGADEHAAQLVGAAGALRRAIGLPPELDDEPESIRMSSIAHSRIGDERWTRAWESGRSLSQSEAIDLALARLLTDDVRS